MGPQLFILVTIAMFQAARNNLSHTFLLINNNLFLLESVEVLKYQSNSTETLQNGKLKAEWLKTLTKQPVAIMLGKIIAIKVSMPLLFKPSLRRRHDNSFFSFKPPEKQGS